MPSVSPSGSPSTRTLVLVLMLVSGSAGTSAVTQGAGLHLRLVDDVAVLDPREGERLAVGGGEAVGGAYADGDVVRALGRAQRSGGARCAGPDEEMR